MGFRFLLSTRKRPLHEVERVAEQLGFDGIEVKLPARDMEGCLKNECRTLRTIRALHLPTAPLALEDFSAALHRAVEFAVNKGIKVIVVRPSVRKKGADAQEQRAVVESYIKSLQCVESCKVCYEVPRAARDVKDHAHQAYDRVASWAADVQVLDLYGALNTAHLAAWHEDPADWPPLLKSKLHHAYVSDYRAAHSREREKLHLLIGEGQIPFPRFFERLRTYCRFQEPFYLTLELTKEYSLEKVQEGIAETLRIMRVALN